MSNTVLTDRRITSPGEPPSVAERYADFLIQEWQRMRPTALLSPTAPAASSTNVLRSTIEILGEAPGLRLEFGVWRGRSIKMCAERFPNQQWVGFDSFEGFPDDGRIDWQKPFKVIELPDIPRNVMLVKGYFSETLDPFLAETPGDVAFVNIDCDIYSSTVDVFSALEKHGRLRPGVVFYFDELINYADYMWNESMALFEMCERTGFGVEWICHDHKLRTPEESAEYFHSGQHPTWNDDMRNGYWMQASCRLTNQGINCGPMDDPAYRAKLAHLVSGFEKHEARRLAAFQERQERLAAQAQERERREIDRKQRDKRRQLENRARRLAEQAGKAD